MKVLNTKVLGGFFAMTLAISLAGTAMAGELKIGAGAAATENVFSKMKTAFEAASGLTLVIQSSGPVDGFKNMEAGKVSGAAIGVSLDELVGMLDKEGFKVTDKSLYKTVPIGRDTIKVICNKDVTVTALSEQQLKDIFTGRVTNWSSVGGPDLEITVIYGSQIPGTHKFFQTMAMGGANYLSEFVGASTAKDVKAKVMELSGAVGLAPKALAGDDVLVPEIKDISRDILMVTKGDPDADTQKLIDFINGEEGQKLIGK